MTGLRGSTQLPQGNQPADQPEPLSPPLCPSSEYFLKWFYCRYGHLEGWRGGGDGEKVRKVHPLSPHCLPGASYLSRDAGDGQAAL